MDRLTFILFLIFISVSFSSLAQIKDPDVILNNLKEAALKINDYVVDVNIKVDVDFLKVPDAAARIYFKQPDRIHFESESFALLPKDGLNFSPASLLKGNYTAFYEKEDEVDGHKTSVIKVIPLGETDNVILSTLWVDQSKNVLRRIESTTKVNGTFLIELNYPDIKSEIILPSEMIFTFNVDKLNLPRTITGEIEPDKKQKPGSSLTTGKVMITYSNYKVNRGIPDSVFEKK